MIQYVVIFSLLLFSLISFSAFGEVVEITTDKSAYYDGDTILVSGIVSTELPVTSISVVIFDPARSTFVAVAPAMSNADGSFSVSIHVGGPLWASYGNYPIQATSENTSKETVVEYLESTVPSTQESTPEPTSNSTPAPELKIPAHFVDESKSPQSYVDRYYNEINYKEWFDTYYSQYSSIYEAVGLEEPVFMPDWIRNNAGWWATGSIPDSTFVTGIEFMLENNIIVISNIPSSENISNDEIPEWIRNNADWWSQEKISDDEFVNSLKYLIQEGIIVIN
jgi:hypothetical protein